MIQPVDLGPSKYSGRDTVLGVIAELLFVLLPLVVVGIVLLVYRNEGLAALLVSPEWSFLAAILMGQSIVKFVTGMLGNRDLVPERIAATVAAVIVLGLVPSLTVLALILAEKKPGPLLVDAQIGLFALSLLAFVFLGGVGHHWIRSRKQICK